MSLLLLASLLSAQSPSWILVWCSMEVGMMSLLPLSVYPPSSPAVESMAKYLIIQSSSGLVLLAATVHPLPTIMTLSLITKMGIPPTTQWVPQVYAGASYTTIFMISTILKVPPMVFLSSYVPLYSVLLPMAGVVMGSVMGLQVMSLKKLLSASSVSHSSWLVLLSPHGHTWVAYMVSYSAALLITLSTILHTQSHHMTQQHTHRYATTTRWALPVAMLSLGGLPPLLGFLPKWLALSAITSTMGTASTMLALSMAMSTFFYLQCSSISLLSHPTLKTQTPTPFHMTCLSITVLGPLSLTLFE